MSVIRYRFSPRIKTGRIFPSFSSRRNVNLEQSNIRAAFA